MSGYLVGDSLLASPFRHSNAISCVAFSADCRLGRRTCEGHLGSFVNDDCESVLVLRGLLLFKAFDV